jgi:hypothetical protein
MQVRGWWRRDGGQSLLPRGAATASRCQPLEPFGSRIRARLPVGQDWGAGGMPGSQQDACGAGARTQLNYELHFNTCLASGSRLSSNACVSSAPDS